MSGDHNHIEVQWQVVYESGQCQTYTTKVRREDIESALDESEVREIIEQCIQLDFIKRICPDYSEAVYAEALELWRESQGGAA